MLKAQLQGLQGNIDADSDTVVGLRAVCRAAVYTNTRLLGHACTRCCDTNVSCCMTPMWPANDVDH